MNDVVVISFLMFAGLLALFALWLTLPSSKGLVGEWFVKRQLTTLAKKYQGLSFHNLMLGEEDRSTQIDNVLITAKAVYVIEVKNYAGRVYGDQSQDQWYQTIRYDNQRKTRSGRTYTKTHIAKHAFYNPIKQNQIHLNAMKAQLSTLTPLPFYNIVLFMNRTNLTHLNLKDDQAFVINRRGLNALVKRIEARSPQTVIDFNHITAEVLANNTFSKSNLKHHIQKIKRKYQK